MGLEFAKKYGYNIYSQFGEDGVIMECIKRIESFSTLTAVEFGAPTFYYCSNTASLSEKGWNVRMYDIDDNIDVRIHKAKITPENVNEIVGSPEILSIDVDGNDYHIWHEYHGYPKIVIIEINSSKEPTIDMIPGEHGASYKSMVELGLSKGYFLVCHTGNLIFVQQQYSDLFPEIDNDPIGNHHLFFDKSHL